MGVRVRILDMAGRTVFDEYVFQNLVEIKNLNSGTYIVEVLNEVEVIHREKVLIVR